MIATVTGLNTTRRPAWAYSLHAEQAVLGALMLDASAWGRIVGIINEGCFLESAHRTIWRYIETLVNQKSVVDSLTVSDALGMYGTLESVGGFRYLGDLVFNTPSAANVEKYAEIVRNYAMLRDLSTVAHRIIGITSSEDVVSVVLASCAQLMADFRSRWELTSPDLQNQGGGDHAARR